jgi:hypothetical protein
MDRPRGLDGNQVIIVLRRAEIGAPFLSREVSFSFGSVVSPPIKDERGVLLPGNSSTTYWHTGAIFACITAAASTVWKCCHIYTETATI